MGIGDIRCARSPSVSQVPVQTLLFGREMMAITSSRPILFSGHSADQRTAVIGGAGGGASRGGRDGGAGVLPLPLRWPKKITSGSNPLVKHCVKLRLSSSYRHSYGLVLVVGLTPILEICSFQKLKDDESSVLDCLLLLDGAEIPQEIFDPSTSVVHVSPIVMKKLSGMQSIDSVEAIALMKIPARFHELNGDQEEMIYQNWFPSPNRILVLDGIQDPGNLGTLIRSAVAFKWDGVFLLPGCCDPFNEKALRAARGASFQVPVVSGNWSHLKVLKTKFKMKMLAGHPANVSDGSFQTSSLSRELAYALADMPLCLVLGSEGHGLSEQTAQACELVSIPMEGTFESLNVSVAGGIFLFMLQPEHLKLL
ncbi:uncharacterized tRNA/rRNA methyltransferase slr1673 [Phoenix dactylifera]|uniref:Uncharacterized tRNA/rRNA methyltransferase slr1673 n=1 Tax=Phoenix dactylifera TaxID=42345 RepID=A0A8B7CD27_PHODC|nr:uncharacterized tRNA/rRNA methyltransferase slr1673 [Phoenix dactylifera]